MPKYEIWLSIIFAIGMGTLTVSCQRTKNLNEDTRPSEYIIDLRKKDNVRTTTSSADMRNISLIRDVVPLENSKIFVLTNVGSMMVFYSEDSGITWTQLHLPSNAGVSTIGFLNSKTGWIVDTEGKLWKTTDGGIEWQIISQIPPESGNVFLEVLQLRFVTEDIGWIVGTLGLRSTEDGGKSWRKVSLAGQPVRAFFLDESKVWITSVEGNGKAWIHKTSDRGKNWKSARLNFNINNGRLFFLDGLTGWIIGNGKCFLTSDGGENWSPYELPDPKFSARDIFWLSPNEGWLAGYNFENPEYSFPRLGKSSLFKTLDGGHTWNRLEISPSDSFFDQVFFSKSGNGLLVSKTRLYLRNLSNESWTGVLGFASDN